MSWTLYCPTSPPFLPHEDKGIPLSALPKDSTIKHTGFFFTSTLSFRVPIRRPVHGKFGIFVVTWQGNWLQAYCEVDSLTTAAVLYCYPLWYGIKHFQKFPLHTWRSLEMAAIFVSLCTFRSLLVLWSSNKLASHWALLWYLMGYSWGAGVNILPTATLPLGYAITKYCAPVSFRSIHTPSN